jgi:hypothetical protein
VAETLDPLHKLGRGILWREGQRVVPKETFGYNLVIGTDLSPSVSAAFTPVTRQWIFRVFAPRYLSDDGRRL